MELKAKTEENLGKSEGIRVFSVVELTRIELATS
jgi:2C-methyl-D-erythritol 2,4-cyclodiphosphate synthase